MPSTDYIRVRRVSLRRGAVSAPVETFPYIYEVISLWLTVKMPASAVADSFSNLKKWPQPLFQNLSHMPTSPQLKEETFSGRPIATTFSMVSGIS